MFKILRGGCNTRHPSSFFTSRPTGNNNWLLLIIRTPCHFEIENKEFQLEGKCAIIIPPQISYFYQNPNGEYIDDWLHFDFSEEILDIKEYLAPLEFFPLEDIDSFSFYIRQLLYENTYANKEVLSSNIDHLMFVLLNNLSSTYKNQSSKKIYNPYFSKLAQIRIEMQSSLYLPKTADDYSKEIGISKSHFQHMYKECFKIAFNQDLIQMRIDYAKDLLETTDMSMEQIAEVCGYTNEVHFYRQFRNVCEMTPAKYRKFFKNFI